ncbi:succinyl-CoA synthetase (ADP-forming) alpha subunit [Desulfotomaculum arcticum]|uniref:Succinyl-CoA synthetase (ADP-forming) alpha subunit n=1 Tax=Desulfotruncus arcticus DSM 17038 TaxID=1121424 RepID=A0A1I2YNQ9_9FIRM|nr:succinate--CoA ligase subunit alpha [Desulfotruncus arcticus]SFH27252.1 succinyl-CoA synthetase (ADP-forming) alpha subunit [Desulfotomaculum arcticum] [Desulfotruncus arcticus DSM 17038]
MAILVNPDIRVIIQGITGKQGTYHTLKMLEYHVHVVGGVTPGKGGQKVHGVTVYDTVAAAQKEHQVDASMIMVPPAGVLSAAIEAIDHKIPLIVIITEFVPVHDSLVIRNMARKAGVRVIGPNTIGVISPGKGKVGIMPGYIYSEGSVGIISRSGTLTHEVSSNLTYKGIGQSTCVCIGGDPVKGTDFVDVLRLFRDDGQTETVVMIGEIGGAGEELAAKYVTENGYPKKIVAFIAGRTAPAGKKMGHAGAIVAEGFGTAESKIKSLAEAGIVVVRTLDELLQAVK